MSRIASWGVLFVIAGCLAAPLPAARSAPASPLWEPVGPGIEYQSFHLADPNNVYVTRMDRHNPNVTLESSIGQGRLSGGVETVRGQAARYDESINYWNETWGNRTKVVAAINGYFYNTNTGVPWRGQVQSGWYAKRFDDLQNGSGFLWGLDRSAAIGECIVHRADKQLISYLATGNTQTIQGVNVPRGDDQLVLYTPQYDAETLTDEKGSEVLVEMTRPVMILPAPGMITGTVRQVRFNHGSTPIPFDHIVLSASGLAQDKLVNNTHIGDIIGISQELKSYEKDCKTPLPISWTKTYASIGGSFHFLKDGVIQTFDDVGALLRNPRTAIAYNNDYIFFIVIDGRDPLRSVGMSIVDLANFAKNTLGATQGIAQDGGGSSTLVVNGQVINNPNTDLRDENEDVNGPPPGQISGTPAAQPALGPRTFLPVIATRRQEATPLPPISTPGPRNERAVANGMMMVVVEPAFFSGKYSAGQAVAAGQGAEVRLGPGSNYAVLVSLPAASQGQVVAHALNGVLAKGNYWWKVSFGDLTGWVAESALSQP